MAKKRIQIPLFLHYEKESTRFSFSLFITASLSAAKLTVHAAVSLIAVAWYQTLCKQFRIEVQLFGNAAARAQLIGGIYTGYIAESALGRYRVLQNEVA